MIPSKLSLALFLLVAPVKAQLDLVFVLDTTASFTLEVPLFQQVFSGIVNDVLTTVDADTHFGVATFEDYGILPFGVETDSPYDRIADLQPNTMNVTTLVAGIVAGLGNDMMESGLTALDQIINGEGQAFGQGMEIPEGLQMNFRDDAIKIIVLWTDSAFNDPEQTPGYPGPSFDSVIASLTNETVQPPFRFVGISRSEDSAAETDLVRLADATGSTNLLGDFECFPGMNVTNNTALVCEGVAAPDATIIQTAFVNMITQAYQLDGADDEFVPLQCGGLYAAVCLIAGGLAAGLSCFT